MKTSRAPQEALASELVQGGDDFLLIPRGHEGSDSERVKAWGARCDLRAQLWGMGQEGAEYLGS